ncbi:MAG: 4-hydroxy-3-methylbut-2-enyl diphosphate reductase [Candidatus Nealsonbacteria bacterium]
MKTIISKNIGFCSGVERAILMAEESIKKDKRPIQFLGSIVHNEEVINKFKKLKVKFIKDIKKAKPGTLIIQAHGIPPLKFKLDNKIIIKDATCPLVKRVQLISKKLLEQGYQVIIIGDKKHSETRGIKGYAKNKAIIIENEIEAEKIPDFKKIGVIAQTTQSLENVNLILKVLKKHSKNIKYINTICPEVKIRQKELKTISKKTDGILIMGSKTSANTKRLVNIAKKTKKPFFFVNTYKELNRKKLSKIKILGIASGASTPNWEIKETIQWLNRKQK